MACDFSKVCRLNSIETLRQSQVYSLRIIQIK